MKLRAVVLVPLAFASIGLAACKFDPPDNGPIDGTPGGGSDAPNPDAPAPPDAFVPPDARVCFGAGLDDVCLPSPPSAPLTLLSGTIDTTTCNNGVRAMFTGVEACVLSGTTVTVPGGSAVQGRGSRPLVIVALDRLTIEGTLSVSSLRSASASGAGASSAQASAQLCSPTPPQDLPENDSGGGGGGAGGSLFGRGGNGGTGDTNGGQGGQGGGGDARPAFVPATLRAGCGGTSGGIAATGAELGEGGPGGGALYLISEVEIVLSGEVSAGGAGGGGADNRGAGGGGGSGGMIGLDAPVVNVSGRLTANGGGGGEGGGVGNTDGDAGNDSTSNGSRAQGGIAESNDGSDADGGNGGLGSGCEAGTVIAAGNPGIGDAGGGGGGGGGAGYIYVKGTFAPSGIVCPTADVK